MTTKNYGPGVSGFLNTDLRAFENQVFQSGKPVLDKELNLTADISSAANQTFLKSVIPSGWISSDFLNTSSSTDAIFSPSLTSNELDIPQLLAHVNGWLIPISNTNVANSNKLSLTAAPVAAASSRTDMVVLEVWRLLISAAPSTTGKSQTARIWWNGNVKIPSGSDTALNPIDDLKDVSVGAETTKRVQIQYRLRVVSNVDTLTYPYGLDDPSVFAHTVPTNATTPDGSATLFTYANQSSGGDPGLWRAGDGDPTNTLGTVDGYMYAIPLMAIFRRNSAGFDKNTNSNGAATSGGASDRPDGLYNDLVDGRDVMDLRMGVNLRGWDYREVLEKNVNLLFDNNLKTEMGSIGLGGGSTGHTLLWADEIGLLPGDGTNTGDTPGAQFVGQFDGGRRFFSARSIYEVVTVAVTPGGAWSDNQVISVQPSALAVYPYSSYDFINRVPNNTTVIDIVRARFIGDSNVKQSVDCPIVSIQNLGANPPIAISLKIGTISSLSITDETLYLDLLVAYPPASGLTKTPTETYGTSSIIINNPGALSAGVPISYDALAASNQIDPTHREVQLQYTTGDLTITVSTDSTGVTNLIRIPERAFSVSSIVINGTPYVGAFSISGNGRTIILGGGNTTSPNGDVAITYRAIRPLPENAAQFSIWYGAREPQTARSAVVGTSISVVPKAISPYLYSLVQGAGSPDDGYPFPQAYVQTGGIYPTSGGIYTGEAELNGTSDVSTADFNANVGMVKVLANVPYTPNPEQVTFNRDNSDTDFEGRTFFKTVPSDTYVPSAFGQGLSDAKKHKVILPMLAETVTDSALCPKGTLVLVCLIRYAIFDSDNFVGFNSDLSQNTTIASVFRLKGNLLNRGA